MIKLNLGCGARYLQGFINIDIDRSYKADLYLDFERDVLPYQDNSIDYIIAIHTLEHINNIWDLLNECHRVLKPNCILEVEVPNIANIPQGLLDSVESMSHIRFFVPSSFKTMTTAGTKAGIKYNKLKRWKIIEIKHNRAIHVRMVPIK